MATLLFFAIWLAAHARARAEEKTPSWLLLPLMALWANLHGGFAARLIFTGFVRGRSRVRRRARRARPRAARSAGVCFSPPPPLAAAITPHRLAGLVFPFRLVGMSTALAGVQEWKPSSLANNPSLIFWTLIVLFAGLQFQPRMRATRLAMTLALIYAAFAHVRHSDLLAVGAPLLLQELADRRSTGRVRRRRAFLGQTLGWRGGLSVALAGLAAVAISLAALARTSEHGANSVTPRAAVDWAWRSRCKAR